MRKNSVQFAVCDILYYDGKDLTYKQLIERKTILSEEVEEENELSISQNIKEKGIAFFNLAKGQRSEESAAKRVRDCTISASEHTTG